MPRFLPSTGSLAAVASGLLLACAFPTPDLPFCAWFGLVPLLLVMERRPFGTGFLAGCVFFGLTLYWLNIVMTTYGHLPWAVSLALYALLIGYLALFWGAATWAACRLRARRGYPATLTLPVFWVALEFLRGMLLSGFPWASLGYSQQAWLPVIQSADLFGVHGISFLLVWFNGVLAGLLGRVFNRSQHLLPRSAVVACLVLVAANLGYGTWRLEGDLDERTDTLRVGLVQGNIPQDLKWVPEHQRQTVEIYRKFSLLADQEENLDLLIWPEAALPFYFQEGGALVEQVHEVVDQTGAALLFGSPAYRREESGVRFLNSAFLLARERQLVGRSDKIHLVPFGEYVPLGQLLPFVDKLVVGIGDFSPGEVNPLALNGHQLGVLVCYEIIFPELARDYVRQGSDLLVNITNDAWFGRSSAPQQHLAMARFRAIENRLWLARAANTGITALIAPSGRVLAETDLFETTYLTGEVGLGARPGFYTRIGDVIPLAFVVVAVAWLWQSRRKPL